MGMEVAIVGVGADATRLRLPTAPVWATGSPGALSPCWLLLPGTSAPLVGAVSATGGCRLIASARDSSSGSESSTKVSQTAVDATC